MAFNLGNFGGQLNLGEVNGALRNVGSDYQVPEDMGAPDAIAPVATITQAPEQPGPAPTVQASGTGFGDTLSDAPLKGIINMQTIGSLIGSYFGGPMGGQIGGALGGMAKGNQDKQKARGMLR